MGIPSRVYGRLHWDKQFHSISLFVKAEGGTVTVRGTLPDEAAKAKAIDLIKDTVGVTRVIDQLTCSLERVIGSPTIKLEPGQPLRSAIHNVIDACSMNSPFEINELQFTSKLLQIIPSISPSASGETGGFAR